MPVRMRSRIISSESHAGPMVQIIFARRERAGTLRDRLGLGQISLHQIQFALLSSRRILRAQIVNESNCSK